MTDRTTWYCNNASHPHPTYGEAQACDLEAQRKRQAEYEEANRRAEEERKKK